MAGVSPIEWTERTWNPIVGCALKSPGCTNCYAMTQAARLERMGVAHYVGLTQSTKAGPVWTGEFRAAPDHVLAEPLRRRKPTTWFVNSMSDLFGEGVLDGWIDRVFAVMALCPQHTFQILTKRPERMRAYITGANWRRIVGSCRDARGVSVILRHSIDALERAFGLSQRFSYDRDLSAWPLPNVWLGASVEDQARADEHRGDLQAVSELGWLAWVSYEPALELVDWSGWEFIRWLVSGGESGRDARPSHPDWHREARDFCAAASIPYFFKQWGAWTPGENAGAITGPQTGAVRFDDRWLVEHYTRREAEELTAETEPDVWRVGKKAAGRHLDGRTWDQRPEVRS